jgi:hypothetical protein
MEKIRQRFDDRKIDNAFQEVVKNAMGNVVLMDNAPTPEQVKANTIVKVKDAADYIYLKAGDGKLLKVPVSEVTS